MSTRLRDSFRLAVSDRTPVRPTPTDRPRRRTRRGGLYDTDRGAAANVGPARDRDADHRAADRRATVADSNAVAQPEPVADGADRHAAAAGVSGPDRRERERAGPADRPADRASAGLR